MRRQAPIVTLVCFSSVLYAACAPPGNDGGNPAPADRVVTIGDLPWPEVDALDRNRTLVLLTVGMLEEHGPHLPIATDTIGVEHETRGVAARLSQSLPDWNVVVMPTVHYGSSGANQIGNIAVHPGTYAIRQSTLRALVADIGAQLAQNRFKWIFVLDGHGAPTHHMAVNEASDFVSQEFKITMANISGLFNADAGIQEKGAAITARFYSPADIASFGRDNHAGVGETSAVLAVRPDLVRSSYRSLPSYRVETLRETRETALKPGWPGYFSSPGRADAAYGREVETWWIENMTDLILQAVRGTDLSSRPRWPGPLQNDPAFAEVFESAMAPDREFQLALARWLDAQKPSQPDPR